MDAMSADSFPLPDVEAMARLKVKAPEAADLLRQLANPTRLLILCHVPLPMRGCRP